MVIGTCLLAAELVTTVFFSLILYGDEALQLSVDYFDLPVRRSRRNIVCW